MNLYSIETSLLTGQWDAPIASNKASDLAKLTVDAKFDAVLTSAEVKRLLIVSGTSEPSALNQLLSLAPPKDADEELTSLVLAILVLCYKCGEALVISSLVGCIQRNGAST
jgi:hypothetical protein